MKIQQAHKGSVPPTRQPSGSELVSGRKNPAPTILCVKNIKFIINTEYRMQGRLVRAGPPTQNKFRTLSLTGGRTTPLRHYSFAKRIFYNNTCLLR